MVVGVGWGLVREAQIDKFLGMHRALRSVPSQISVGVGFRMKVYFFTLL